VVSVMPRLLCVALLVQSAVAPSTIAVTAELYRINLVLLQQQRCEFRQRAAGLTLSLF